MTIEESITQIARSVSESYITIFPRNFTPAEKLLLLAVKFALGLSQNGDFIFIPIILDCLKVVSGGHWMLEYLVVHLW